MKIDEALLRRVDERVRATLAHKDVPHPKLIVTFSAPPSAGKSTLAKQLVQRLQAVRLENDTVRTLAAEWFPESSLQEYSDLAHSYCDYSWPRLAQEIPNGLWVIDSSLDRNHQIVFDFAKQYGLRYLLLHSKCQRICTRSGLWRAATGRSQARPPT